MFCKNRKIVDDMVRIAYFGTDGCPGHHVIPIRGKFTEEDIKVIESIDCDDFYKVFDVMRFKIAEFKGWTILGIPASLDDHRPGSKTVIFIEGKANESNFVEVIQEFPFLEKKVKKLIKLYYDEEWLTTGKINQDPPNKEQFQFTLDKDDVINMIRGIVFDPYSDVANEIEKIGLGESYYSPYIGPAWSWFDNKVYPGQKIGVWDGFSVEFLWDLYCKIKKA